MEGRDLNDSAILQATMQETDGDKVRYSTVLPSGRKVASEWMRQEDMQGKTVITWCEFIRDQVDIDAREKSAAKKRQSVEPEDVEKELQEQSVSEETNPVDYARAQRDAYQERVNILEERIVSMQQERKQCRLHLENWETIVNSLRGETDE